jgi:hypothetical protein
MSGENGYVCESGLCGILLVSKKLELFAIHASNVIFGLLDSSLAFEGILVSHGFSFHVVLLVLHPIHPWWYYWGS